MANKKAQKEKEKEQEALQAQDSSNNVVDQNRVNAELKIYEKLNNMDSETRRIVIKIVQFKAMMEMLKAIKNLKNTPKEVWQRVIYKLNAISGLNAGEDESGFDFNKMLKVLIPLLGTLAGILLGLRASEKAEQESAEPEQQEELEETVNKIQSVVLQYCQNNENGFSNHG